MSSLGKSTRATSSFALRSWIGATPPSGSVVVEDSVRDPLSYYRNNTVNSRGLIETAVKEGVRHFIFSSTCAVYGNPKRVPAHEEDATVPTSPYGSSKLMRSEERRVGK